MMEKKMEYYDPEESYNFNQVTTLIYTFQYQDAFAQVQTTMGGDAVGGEAMTTDFECGMTASVNEELNKKHVLFDDEYAPGELEAPEYQEVAELIFHYPDGRTVHIDIEDCTKYLIGINIIKYDPRLED
ncbi:hypothetical protein M3_0122 [Lysinibacillus phage vB_LfM_LysYB1]|nr:hypothetical protein M3_0122 [Lysinibacillus phage vB_LfM_LysYB1]WAB25368.1 hypothetical protein M5_0190 [Lysinibacillus phage vB_LfM_LysYB2]